VLLRADPDNLTAAMTAQARTAGSALFAANCTACHGAGGKGDARLGVPNLADRDWLYGNGKISEIAQTVRYGIRSGDPRAHNLADMPAYAHAVPYAREKLPSLAPNEVQDLVAFLVRTGGRAADMPAAERGEKLFKTRGGCWDCHGEDARGDNAVGAPDLTDSVWLFGEGGPGDLFRSIADGHQGVCPAFVGRLSAAEILEVAVYVRSLEGT
jgi:cytochrome c oxidase cbb3-type subunit 3